MWRRTLSQIPTDFGRLVYLTSLFDKATSRYTHSALSHLLGADDTDRILRHSHHQTFSRWLGFGLAEQKSDLEAYLRSSGTAAHSLVYRNLVPSTAHEVERQLFITDLETLLELLKFDPGGAFSTPKA